MSSLFLNYGIPFVSGALMAYYFPVGIGALEMGAVMTASAVAINYYYGSDTDADAGAIMWAPGLVYFGVATATGGMTASTNAIVGSTGTSALITVLIVAFTVI